MWTLGAALAGQRKQAGGQAGDAVNDGTQSIERALKVLRMLATRGRLGWGLTDLAQAAGLKKATVHRILVRLEHERMAHRRASDAHYFLGPALADLSFSIPGFHPFVRAAQDFLAEMSRRYSLVTILSIRSGDHFVVGARLAPARFKGELNEPGARRPLMTTAGGIAILMSLEAAETSRIVADNLELLSQRGRTSVEEYRAMWDRSTVRGYASNFGDIAPGVNAVAMPVLGQAGQVFASLTLAGGVDHVRIDGADELAAALRHECVEIARLAAQIHPGLYAGPCRM